MKRTSLLIEMPRQPVTVLVADGQPLFRSAVSRTVTGDARLALSAVVRDGNAALRAIREHAPAVAVLGAPLAGVSAHDVAHAVRRDELETRIVVLLADDDPAAAFDALADGATGCLTRAVEPGRLAAAIVAVAGGRSVVAPELQSGVHRQIHLRHRGNGPLVSPREREILGLVADGQATADIARLLHLAPTTVKTHLGHAYEKLGVSDRAAAVAAAMRLRLLE
jgi:two-component system, NarL family, nitrate/nitrite response regulator NarL